MIGRAVLLSAAMLCLLTAGRIEYWNWKADGAIQKKLEQEPNSKWRAGTIRGALHFAKAEIRFRDQIPEGSPLTEAQEKEAESTARARVPYARNHVGYLLATWGIWQIPLGLLLMISSLIAAARIERGRAGFYVWTASAGAIALFFAFYRDYWRALGW